MKKNILFIMAVLLIAGLVYSLKTVAPFVAVTGISMEPALHQGDLIIIEKILPQDVQKGEIIVTNVPGEIQSHYNYPPVIAHRVIEINKKEEAITFRTAGDNTGRDVFVARPSDLRGKIGRQIPYLGYLLLFLQSQQGLIAIGVLLFFWGIIVYKQELRRCGKKFSTVVFSTVLQGQEEIRKTQMEYAKNIKSHTRAIRNLSRAAEKLVEITEKLGEKID